MENKVCITQFTYLYTMETRNKDNFE